MVGNCLDSFASYPPILPNLDVESLPPTRPIWTALHASLHQTLRQRQLLEKNQCLLIAVSGGQDSLGLLKLLLDLQPKWGWRLAIAHCDHRWRPDSSANAAHVEHLAEAWQLPFYSQTAVAPPRSEAQAREWRYEVLAAIAQSNHYPYVVTGHTASDRAETLLYNLCRGSGADGLQALTWQRSLGPQTQLVRPLLEITRAEIKRFCQTFQLPVWQDATNQDLKYARNRIRQELLPYLQAHFNPQVEQALAQTAEVLRAEVDYLESAAAALLQQARVSAGASRAESLRLNRRILQQAPLALQRRAVRQFLQQTLLTMPSFEQIEAMTALIQAANRTRSQPFAGGMVAEVADRWILLK